MLFESILTCVRTCTVEKWYIIFCYVCRKSVFFCFVFVFCAKTLDHNFSSDSSLITTVGEKIYSTARPFLLNQHLYPLLVDYGSVFEPRCINSCIICVVGKGRGATMHGQSRDQEKEYAHANLYESRSALFSLSRAVRRDHPQHDEAIIWHTENGSPAIANLIAHFAPGRALEFIIAMKQLESSRHRHFVQGIYCDTTKDRQSYMHESLMLMYKEIAKLVSRPRSTTFSGRGAVINILLRRGSCPSTCKLTLLH